MFVQHMLAVLKPDGIVATVMPHGVLFRGGDEGEIRQRIIDDDLLDAVIGLGPNLFYGTGIPACILVLRAKGSKPPERQGKVLFINADREYTEGRAQNYLRPSTIEKIVAAYRGVRRHRRLRHGRRPRRAGRQRLQLQHPPLRRQRPAARAAGRARPPPRRRPGRRDRRRRCAARRGRGRRRRRCSPTAATATPTGTTTQHRRQAGTLPTTRSVTPSPPSTPATGWRSGGPRRHARRCWGCRRPVVPSPFAPVISGDYNDPPEYHPWTDKLQQETRIERFKMPLGSLDDDGHDPLGLVIVKSMLLTGFDAPHAQVLYLDRLIQEAELLQAIARVNRTAPRKSYGLVVDYYGVSTQLTHALAAYTSAGDPRPRCRRGTAAAHRRDRQARPATPTSPSTIRPARRRTPGDTGGGGGLRPAARRSTSARRIRCRAEVVPRHARHGSATARRTPVRRRRHPVR